MVAAAPRHCRECGRALPLEPIPRYHVCELCGWEPAPLEVEPGVWTEDSPQKRFLEADAYEVGYGGAAGGGKSESLLMDALRDIAHPQYRALLLRRTIREMRRSLIDRALTGWYNIVAPGGFVGSPSPLWRFPSGAIVEFGNLETEKDLENYQSAEYQYIGFDELAHFTRHMYSYMQSRLRSSHGIRSRVRSGFNPPSDMIGAWVVDHFAPWVNDGPDYHGVRAKSGQTLYVIPSSISGDRYVPRGTLDELGNPAAGRCFIRALSKQNPYLDRNDPGYRSRLLGLVDAVTREQLLNGNFAQFDKPGALWARAVIDAGRRSSHPPLYRIGVALDPSGSHRKGSDEAGIIVGGMGPCSCSGERENHLFVTDDLSDILAADAQSRRVIAAYHDKRADFVVAEINYGGDWVKTTIGLIDSTVNVDVIHVSKGKAVRAEPVASLYGALQDVAERLPDGRTRSTTKLVGCKVHHVGTFATLENQQCTLDPREPPKVSPGALDALVFLASKMLLGAPMGVEGVHSEGERRIDPRRDRGRMMT